MAETLLGTFLQCPNRECGWYITEEMREIANNPVCRGCEKHRWDDYKVIPRRRDHTVTKELLHTELNAAFTKLTSLALMLHMPVAKQRLLDLHRWMINAIDKSTYPER
jgi:hypothetical protein